MSAERRHHGFLRIGASSSHQKWRHPLTGKQVIIAQHRGRVLPLGTMRAIIAGSGIEPSEMPSTETRDSETSVSR